MELKPGNAQIIGSRQEQEDAFGFYGYGQDTFTSHGGVLMVLADGMGKSSHGREASHLAVQHTMKAYGEKTPSEPIPNALKRALTASNQAVYELACATNSEGRVGSTLVAAVIWEQNLYWISIGDSRLYLMRAGEPTITQCILEHRQRARDLLPQAAGRSLQEQPQDHSYREALTSFLGLELLSKVDSNIHPLLLNNGDRLILCSDGIHGTLSDQELSQLLKHTDVQVAAEAVIEAIKTKANANQDNATVVLLECWNESSTVTQPNIKADTADMWRQYHKWQVPLGVATALTIGAALGWNLARIRLESKSAITVFQATSSSQPISLPLPPEQETVLANKDPKPDSLQTTRAKSKDQALQDASTEDEIPESKPKSKPVSRAEQGQNESKSRSKRSIPQSEADTTDVDTDRNDSTTTNATTQTDGSTTVSQNQSQNQASRSPKPFYDMHWSNSNRKSSDTSTTTTRHRTERSHNSGTSPQESSDQSDLKPPDTAPDPHRVARSESNHHKHPVSPSALKHRATTTSKANDSQSEPLIPPPTQERNQ